MQHGRHRTHDPIAPAEKPGRQENRGFVDVELISAPVGSVRAVEAGEALGKTFVACDDRFCLHVDLRRKTCDGTTDVGNASAPAAVASSLPPPVEI